MSLIGELEAAKTSCMLKAIIHLIACANKEGFDWLKLVLELAKLVIEKGMFDILCDKGGPKIWKVRLWHCN